MEPRSGGACLVCLSDNYDHQTATYSLFRELESDERFYTAGIESPKAAHPNTDRNIYHDCPKRPGLTKKAFDFKSLRSLCGKIESTGCETLYFESVHIWNLYLARKLKGKMKIVQTIHDVIPHGDARGVLELQRMLCNCADLVVIKSEALKEAACRLYKLNSSKILVLPIWHHFPAYQSPSNSGVFLFFGRIKLYKGIAYMPLICASCPNIKFVVAGAVDEGSGQYIEDLKNLPNVNIIDGTISPEKMNELFRDADWTILPYISASQSGVVVDSYERSRPVISFDVGALKEQIADGETGYLIPEADIGGFTQALMQAASLSTKEHERFCENAYRYGYDHSSSQAIASQFAELFLDGRAWR